MIQTLIGLLDSFIIRQLILNASKFIFNGEIRLVFRFEVYIGAAVLIENTSAGVSHDGVLCFVCAFEYLLKRL